MVTAVLGTTVGSGNRPTRILPIFFSSNFSPHDSFTLHDLILLPRKIHHHHQPFLGRSIDGAASLHIYQHKFPILHIKHQPFETMIIERVYIHPMFPTLHPLCTPITPLSPSCSEQILQHCTIRREMEHIPLWTRSPTKIQLSLQSKTITI